jgi:SAM-dependent methyltransferase
VASNAPPAPPALAFTGERYTPEVKGAIWHEHWHRYALARPLAAGRRVLDAACGEGYGSYLLAQVAAEVTGIDVSSEAVAHAGARYAAPNLRYVHGSVAALPLADGSVDLVVSFETIEHLLQQAEMLAEFRRVLVPHGVLVISSPNRPVYSGEAEGHNEFHVRELDRAELAALLDPRFPQQRWYCQRVVAHSMLWAEGAAHGSGRAVSVLALDGDAVVVPPEPAPPMYYVVVCGAASAALPPLPDVALFDDGAQSLYRDYQRALLREKQLYWDELDARKIAEERLAEAIGHANALAAERAAGAAMRAELDAARADARRAREVLDETVARNARLDSWRGWLRWPLGRIRRLLRGG